MNQIILRAARNLQPGDVIEWQGQHEMIHAVLLELSRTTLALAGKRQVYLDPAKPVRIIPNPQRQPDNDDTRRTRQRPPEGQTKVRNRISKTPCLDAARVPERQTLRAIAT